MCNVIYIIQYEFIHLSVDGPKIFQKAGTVGWDYRTRFSFHFLFNRFYIKYKTLMLFINKKKYKTYLVIYLFLKNLLL